MEKMETWPQFNTCKKSYNIVMFKNVKNIMQYLKQSTHFFEVNMNLNS